MISFTTITQGKYKKSVDNERKIFDLTNNFTTREILNKYRHSDKNIEDKIRKDEKIKEKYENMDRLINKNIDKLKIKPANDFIANYNNNDDDDKTISVLDKTDYDYVNVFSEIYKQSYKFNTDEDILNSFSKIYREYDMEYNPRQNTRYYQVRYLLNKLNENENIPVDLYNHFHTTLSENNKAYRIIPIDKKEQTGSSVNNIIINDNDLNNGLLKVCYLNNRKLSNNILKHDYKISKNMVSAIKYNKDIYRLSKNEMKIYHELQKFLNKEQDINILIGSYLSGNNSKK